MATETWTPQEIVNKVDWEGGWGEFYHWGGLSQRTGNGPIDLQLEQLQRAYKEVDIIRGRLSQLLPEPGEEDWDDEPEECTCGAAGDERCTCG